MDDFYGGLEKLIGDCRKDVAKAMAEEHCEVAACRRCTKGPKCTCFGASDLKFTTSNYKVPWASSSFSHSARPPGPGGERCAKP